MHDWISGTWVFWSFTILISGNNWLECLWKCSISLLLTRLTSVKGTSFNDNYDNFSQIPLFTSSTLFSQAFLTIDTFPSISRSSAMLLLFLNFFPIDSSSPGARSFVTFCSPTLSILIILSAGCMYLWLGARLAAIMKSKSNSLNKQMDATLMDETPACFVGLFHHPYISSGLVGCARVL